MQRVTDGLLLPVGSPKNIISKVELKLSALQLPPLDAGHPPPSTVLLEHTRKLNASSNKRSLTEVEGKGKDAGTAAGSSKAPKVVKY